MPAKSWDSHKETLLDAIQAIQPKYCFEFGPGVSTDIIQNSPSVIHLTSVEHDPVWYERRRKAFNDNVTLHLETNIDDYATYRGEHQPYDLVFVDGTNRQRCIREARNLVSPDGIIVIHDADREEYKEAIGEYKFVYFTDDGNTVVVTDNKNVLDKFLKVAMCV